MRVKKDRNFRFDLKSILKHLRRKYRNWKVRRQISSDYELKNFEQRMLNEVFTDTRVPYLVHSSTEILRLGGVDLSSFISVLSGHLEESALMMPAFTFDSYMLDYLNRNPNVNLDFAPSKMGLLTEIFRRYPGVTRSIHPTHSVCSRGDLTNYLVGSHHRSISPFDEFSPFSRLGEKNGIIVLIAVDISVLTSVHVAEDELGLFFKFSPYISGLEFNVDVIYDKKHYRVKSTAHDPVVSRKKNIKKFYKPLKDSGILEEFDLDGVRVLKIKAEDLKNFLKDMNSANVTIYG